ncbi:Fur family transcriptional regulator [Pukyongiella litopenaei]|uniref:Transcriptional repressor n=1 Tax=Pukyongiella litopenaei TaxID=2605946 RepID=A0A2S0MKF0_9RHOB|nr:Fur family transcriptional regulator [Pukyongiella litopenaei]AVO36332.1 transcriptional repressor [Pukyongiella litopenaei]
MTQSSQPAFAPHDHSHCISDALRMAERRCTERGVKFTPARRRALEILLAEHRALGAYDILDQFAAEGLGSQPPTVYRALEFLVSNGLAHRIERLNAYAACSCLGRDHVPAFLICRACRAVAEAETGLEQGRLGEAARATGFSLERVVVEAEGLCPACARTEAAAP